MITGAKFWEPRGVSYYIQTNNAIESILKKQIALLKAEKKIEWLESCAVEAGASCAASMGHDVTVSLPGGGTIQAGDACVIWANDPSNYKKLQIARDINPDLYMGNEIPQWLPVIFKEVLGVNTQFETGLSWKRLVSFLKGGHAVELHLIKPGHFISALAYDDKELEIIYNDSWPGRRGLRNKGFHERLTESEYDKSFSKYGIVFF